MKNRLNIFERRKAFRMGVDSIREAEGDFKKAEAIFREKAQKYEIDLATVLLMLEIAYKIWRWIKDNFPPDAVSFSDEDVDTLLLQMGV